MEADLRRYYPGTVRAALTWRELAALVRHLPPEAAIHGHGWSIAAMLLADVYSALTGERHPSDPRTPARAAVDRNALTAARRRAAARRARLGISGSVLRKEARP